jgi:hypothetical protein
MTPEELLAELGKRINCALNSRHFFISISSETTKQNQIDHFYFQRGMCSLDVEKSLEEVLKLFKGNSDVVEQEKKQDFVFLIL